MRRASARPLALLAALLLWAGCGGEDAPLPPLAWTWVPLEGAVCSDGSATGIGVAPGPDPSPGVLVFLMGGGACWDYLTCFQLGTATPGPFGAADLDEAVRTLAPGSVLDRAVPGNPYKDFTFVFVPYCTGDVHAGDALGFYPPATSAWRHAGATNLAAVFAYLSSSLAPPDRVVVAGSSAGGFGSLLAFDLARTAWPSAKGYLVDDSGPPIASIPGAIVDLWYASWNLDATVTPLCGEICKTDFSQVFPALRQRHPADRLALLSTTQDSTVRLFFGGMSAQDFEGAVRALAAQIEDAAEPGQTHAFLVDGAQATSHTMLGNPGAFTSSGVPLLEWLRRQVEDDPAWAAALPPP